MIEKGNSEHCQEDNNSSNINNSISHNKLITVFSNNNITNGGKNTYDNVSDNKIAEANNILDKSTKYLESVSNLTLASFNPIF